MRIYCVSFIHGCWNGKIDKNNVMVYWSRDTVRYVVKC